MVISGLHDISHFRPNHIESSVAVVESHLDAYPCTGGPTCLERSRTSVKIHPFCHGALQPVDHICVTPMRSSRLLVWSGTQLQ